MEQHPDKNIPTLFPKGWIPPPGWESRAPIPQKAGKTKRCQLVRGRKINIQEGESPEGSGVGTVGRDSQISRKGIPAAVTDPGHGFGIIPRENGADFGSLRLLQQLLPLPSPNPRSWESGKNGSRIFRSASILYSHLCDYPKIPAPGVPASKGRAGKGQGQGWRGRNPGNVLG